MILHSHLISQPGTGLSAKCVEQGGADLILVYNSGRFRMAGRGSLAGMMPYSDANAVVVDMVCVTYLFGGAWFEEAISSQRLIDFLGKRSCTRREKHSRASRRLWH